MMRRAQPWLGTLVDISIPDVPDATQRARHFQAAFACVAEVHRLMSFHTADSDIGRINRAVVGQAVQIDAHTAKVIDTALMLHAASSGIFNISCGTRLVQWKLLPNPAEPTTDALPEFQAQDCGLEFTDRQVVRKTRPVLIDLGGIAKGYAVDLAIAALHAVGVRSACVNAGGDLRVLGKHPYPILVRNPRQIHTAGAQLRLTEAALATSANYFSRRKFAGNTVSALIDGSTGAPIDSEASVSVIAPSCMLADALTKIVLASGDVAHSLLPRFGARAFII